MGHAYMDIVFAYLAGLLTLINPCVLPVLPIVVASSLQADRRAPLFLAAGMSVSFVFLGLGVAAIGPGLGITEDVVSRTAAARRVFNAARQRCLPSPLPRLKPNAC